MPGGGSGSYSFTGKTPLPVKVFWIIAMCLFIAVQILQHVHGFWTSSTFDIQHSYAMRIGGKLCYVPSWLGQLLDVDFLLFIPLVGFAYLFHYLYRDQIIFVPSQRFADVRPRIPWKQSTPFAFEELGITVLTLLTVYALRRAPIGALPTIGLIGTVALGGLIALVLRARTFNRKVRLEDYALPQPTEIYVYCGVLMVVVSMWATIFIVYLL